MKNSFIVLLIATILFFHQPVFAQTPLAVLPLTQLQVSDKNTITLEIRGLDIVDVLKMLSGRTGMSIVVGKNVTGKVTLFLKDVDPWEAFEIVVLSNDLAYEKTGKIVTVMTQRDYEQLYGERFQDKKEAKIIPLKFAKAQDLSRALNQMKTSVGKVVSDETSNTLILTDTPEKMKEMTNFITSIDGPLESKVFTLNYAQAAKIQTMLQEVSTKGIGSVKLDERTNKIAVSDYHEKVEEMTRLVSAFDEKTQQVLIDAQIIEVSPSDKLEMGIDWDLWIKKHFRTSTLLPIGDANRLFLGTPSDSPQKPGDYKAVLDALRTVGDTKILSSPRIMALNNQEAKILVGTKEAYITSTTTVTQQNPITTQSVNFVDVGIKLYVTPTINSDGFVTMKIRPEISSATRTDITSEGQITQIPIVTTSEAETTVMVKAGTTLLIGGLQKDERNKTVKKVPLVGDIPFLGALFRSTSDELTKSELVILLTPHLMSGETSFTDISEIKPIEGAVATMTKGEIVVEKTSQSRQQAALSIFSNYYGEVKSKIAYISRLNLPPKHLKGEVNLEFLLKRDGSLASQPKIISATDPSLRKYALQAIKDAHPFPPFPKELGKDKATFTVLLSYE
ncbi:MAG: energy transducer TonB [Candidatus Omnitrophica bacterium]|nr:energy transducer TonB [Candidatus Omnitrophota bacterium]